MNALKSHLSLLGLLALTLGLAGCRPNYPNCNEDTHCSDRNEVCVEGTCRECDGDKGCKEGFVCKDFMCKPAPQCSRDDQCPSGQVCRNEKCEAECTADAACGTGRKCLEGRCVADDRCTTDGDCAGGRSCVDGRCVTQDRSISTSTGTATGTGTGTTTTGGITIDNGTATGTGTGVVTNTPDEPCALQTVYFDYNDAELSDDARSALSSNAACINERSLAVTIEGHADERGTEEYNLLLGERRANAAMRYVVNLGVNSEKVTTVTYGKERPVDPGHTEAAWSRNRRAQFIEQ